MHPFSSSSSSKLFHGCRVDWEELTGSAFWMSLSGTQSNNVARPWKPSLSLLAVSQESQHKGGFCLRARPLVSVGSRSIYPENKSNTLHKGDAGGCLHVFYMTTTSPLPLSWRSVKEIIAIFRFLGKQEDSFYCVWHVDYTLQCLNTSFVLHNENLFLWPAELKRQSETQTDGPLCPTIRWRKTLTKNPTSIVISCYWMKKCIELIFKCGRTSLLPNLFCSSTDKNDNKKEKQKAHKSEYKNIKAVKSNHIIPQ